MPSQYVVVSATELRRLFNDGRFYERMCHGEFHEVLLDEGIPSRRSNQPAGTMSRSYEYLTDTGDRIAVVHQFEDPKGNILASHLPDPKSLVIDDVLYDLEED